MSEETAHTHNESTCIFCEATGAMKTFFREVGPSQEARNHFRQSRIEFLKGIRRIIDDRIEHIGRSGQKGTHVTVE